MQHDQGYRGILRVQAAAGPSGNVDGCAVGNQFRERHWHWIGNTYVYVRIGYRPISGGNRRNTRQGSWKTDGNLRSRIAVRRRVCAGHRIWLGAAIEGRADPSKIEPGEVGTGGWIGACQEQVRRSGLASGIGRSLGHLPVRPDLRVIRGQPHHRKQEDTNENDNDEEGLSPLRGQSLRAGEWTFHVIEPPFSLRHRFSLWLCLRNY